MPDGQAFLDTIEAIEGFPVAAGGQWRVPEEAKDRVVELLEERFLGDDLPGNASRWARAVYDNLLRSGPGRRSQASARDAEGTAGAVVETQSDESAVPVQWKQKFQSIRACLVSVLSLRESRTLDYLLAGVSMKEIARRERCSPKAVRNRRARIAIKARRLLEKA